MKIKGTSVVNYYNFVKNNHANRFNEWLNALPQDSKEIYSSVILTTNWYDLDASYIEPVKLIAEMFFNKNYAKTAYDLAFQSSQNALNGIYKVFIKIASIDFVIKRASSIVTTYYSDVKVEIFESNKDYMTMKVFGFVKGQELVFDGFCGWISGLFSFILKTKYSVIQEYNVLNNNDLIGEVTVKYKID